LGDNEEEEAKKKRKHFLLSSASSKGILYCLKGIIKKYNEKKKERKNMEYFYSICVKNKL
jgi:hypothetical protein